MSKEISPLPWAVAEWAARDGDGAIECTGVQVVDAQGFAISACATEGATEQEESDVAFIVKAVNSHDALKDALTELLRECEMHTGWPKDLSTYAKVRAALAAAGAQ